jgi:peptidoglycan/xylan/chitin deacetylase (PgdA/CDA1 family)
MGGLYVGVQGYGYFRPGAHAAGRGGASFQPAVARSQAERGAAESSPTRSPEDAAKPEAERASAAVVDEEKDRHVVDGDAEPAEPEPAQVQVEEAAATGTPRESERSTPPPAPGGSHPAAQPTLPAPTPAAARVPAEKRLSTASGPVPPVEIDRAATGRKEVALTFDAGADWKPARQILEELAAEGVKSTFFLTGEWVTQNPKTTRRIAAEGHEVGNHSWDHPPFTRLTDEQIADQLRRTDAVIQETAGVSSHPYFRPPLGDRDPRVRKAIGDQGFFTIYWTLDSHDSVKKGITAAEIRDRVLSKVAPGSIVLMHCGSQATADALPEILKGLRARGLTPVTVSQLLAR